MYLWASQQVLDTYVQSTESCSGMQRTLPCIMLDADLCAILGSGKHELKETRHIQSPCSSGVNKRYTEVAILFHCFRFRYLISTKSSLFTLEIIYFFVCLCDSVTIPPLVQLLKVQELSNFVMRKMNKQRNYTACSFQRLSVGLCVFKTDQVLPRKQLQFV